MSVLNHPAMDDQPELPATPRNPTLPEMNRGDRLKTLFLNYETYLNCNPKLAAITLDKIKQELREQGVMN